MKINNHSDSVDISSLARNKRGDKAAAAKKAQEAANSAEASGAGATGAAAGVEISSEAKSLAAANSIARSENVDQAKIDRIKAMINGGTYKPDMGKVADKMLNETLLQDIS
jgi:flagellar biosynthesis anti-sigma factor FlgM